MHVEHMTASAVEAVVINDALLATHIPIDHPMYRDVLLLEDRDNDNAVVLAGTPEQLVALADRIAAAVASLRQPTEARGGPNE